MSAFTLFEDTSRNIAHLDILGDDIAFLQQVLGGNLMFDHLGNMRIMHYVGFLQKNNTRIQILPKIYSNAVDISEEEEIPEAFRFMFQMLVETGFIEYKRLDVSSVSTHQNDLFEVLIHIFISEFEKVFHRNRFNDYVVIKGNLSFIKGKIDFASSIRRNNVYKYLHTQIFDEFTIDNPIIIFFKATMVRLLRVTKNVRNKTLLEKNVTFLQDVSDRPLSGSLIDAVIFNRRNQDFKPSFNLAKLFFNNAIAGVQAGKENTFSFLIPLNRLFEQYVALKLKRFNNQKHTFQHHTEAMGALLASGKNTLLGIIPDITYSVDDQIVAILDAKYKQSMSPSATADRYIVRREDIYQLVTYASYCGCKIIMPVYPKFKGKPSDFHIGSFSVKLHNNIIALEPVHINLEDDKEFEDVFNLLTMLTAQNKRQSD